LQEQIRETTPTGHHKQSTASHPPAASADPTIQSPTILSTTTSSQAGYHGASRSLSAAIASGSTQLANSTIATELTSLAINLRSALRQFRDFPSPGILFEDIMPIFANPSLHESLIRALEIHVLQTYGADNKPDVIVGLEARGFLFGPSLALRLNAGFVPVRKKGKLPGPTETASYKKEYGEDFFQMQKDAVKAGQKVLIVDDIIATGK
jgi:adenine phosphoribosyltransferase